MAPMLKNKIKVSSVQVNTLGNANYANSLRRGMAESDTIAFDSVWVDENAGLLEKLLFKLVTFSLPFGSQLRISHFEFIRFRYELAYGIYGYQRALHMLRKHKPDILHFCTQTPASVSARLAKIVPLVVSLDMTARQAAMELTNPRHSWTYKPMDATDKRVFEAASAIFPMSQWAADSVVKDYGIAREKVHVIYPWIDLQKFPVSDRVSRNGNKPLQLLFIGNDFIRKGGQDLVDVFNAHFSETCALHLVTGADVKFDNPRIFVHHNVDAFSPEWHALYDEADVFVLPTHFDAFGLVIGEAMASGLPIVATRINAIPEMVIEGENGLLFEPRDQAALANVLSRLKDDPRLRWEMGAKSRKRAELLFDATTNIARMETIFCEVATARA